MEDKKRYDPIEDSKKKFTLQAFAEVCKNEIDAYVKVWDGSDGEKQNEFVSGEHTWNEWLNHFIRFMSW